MSLTDVLQFVSNLFMVITVPIYITYLITLFKNRKHETLKAPFFKLMFSIGIADIGMIVSLIMGNALAASGLVPEMFLFMGGLSSRLYNIGLFGFGFAQNIGVLLVAFNRYSAYMRPMKHSTIWSDTVARNAIIVQWILSFIVISPLLFYFDFDIQLQSDNRTVLLQWTNVNMNTIYSIFTTGIISGLIAIVLMFIYAVIFLSALKKKIVSKQPFSNVEKTALKMATTGFISSIGLNIYLIDTYIFLGSWYLFRINFPSVDTYYLMFNVGNSIYAAVNPYAMFLFSSSVRFRFAELFCSAWHPQNGAQSTVTVSQVRSIRVQPLNRKVI